MIVEEMRNEMILASMIYAVMRWIGVEKRTIDNVERTKDVD